MKLDWLDWLHGRPPLKRGIWLILVGIAGCVAMLIWPLILTAVAPAPTFAASLTLAPTGGNASVRYYCPECGVVSATREIAHAATGLSSGIEVTVRMRDGSNRQFADANPANWRVGERMIFIDGDNQAGN